MATVEAAPAGWYADPSGAGQQRYWDGATWTEHTAPAPPASPSAPAPGDGSGMPGAPGVPQATNGKAVASLVLSLVWLAGLGSLAAVVLGAMAHRETRERRQPGGGLALAGIIIGVVGLVVPALLAAVIAVPVFQSQRDQAQVAALQSDLRDGAVLYEVFYTDHGTYPESVLEAGWQPASAAQAHGYLSDDGNAYCIEVMAVTGAWWSYASDGPGIRAGRC